jgi:hypothetical protein
MLQTILHYCAKFMAKAMAHIIQAAISIHLNVMQGFVCLLPTNSAVSVCAWMHVYPLHVLIISTDRTKTVRFGVRVD